MAANRRPTKAETRRARAEAARAAIAMAERRRRMIRLGVWAAAGVALVVVVFIGIVALNRPGPPPATEPSATSAAGEGRTTNPPWTAPADAAAAVAAAGLPMLGEEGNALHIHAHLDIVVNGAPVPVAADIGIDEEHHQISPLHSHDPDGVIHIESPDRSATFTLGQFFREWQVSLGTDHIGGLVADDTHHLKVFVNGNLRPGDATDLVLAAHDEIAIMYGTDAQLVNVPSTYAWTNGL